MNRRELLAAAVTTAVAAPLLAADEESGWIDAHSHIWTSDVARYPLAAGQPIDVLAPRDFTAEQLIALGKPLGVRRFVLIQHKPHHGLDNSYILDAIARHAGVFSAVACIEAAQPRPQDDMRRLARGGVRGFRIRPGEGGTEHWRDSPGMCAVWECAAETGLAVCPLINSEHLSAVAEMCRRYPQTRVVVDHFARIGVDGEIRAAEVQSLCDLARYPHAHVKVSAFYALGRKAPPYDDLRPMIRRLCDAFTPTRLMWATDCPYQLTPPNSYEASFSLVHDRLDFLSAADRDHLLRDTAERIFFSDAAL